MGEAGGDKFVSPGDIMLLEMALAYDKGISPCEFRKCKVSDLNFIAELRDARAKKRKLIQEEKEHEMKVEQMMRMMQNG